MKVIVLVDRLRGISQEHEGCDYEKGDAGEIDIVLLEDDVVIDTYAAGQWDQVSRVLEGTEDWPEHLKGGYEVESDTGETNSPVSIGMEPSTTPAPKFGPEEVDGMEFLGIEESETENQVILRYGKTGLI